MDGRKGSLGPGGGDGHKQHEHEQRSAHRAYIGRPRSFSSPDPSFEGRPDRTDPDFNINFREFGFTDQIHINLDPTQDSDVELVLYRSRDVGQRERLIMKLLRPHLAAMYRAAGFRQRLARAAKELDGEAMATLTPREREVIHCVAEGLTNREIAAELVVEPSTVRKHLEQVYEKLGVGSRTAALAKLRDLTQGDGVAQPVT